MVSLTAGLRELCSIVRDATFPRVGREEAEALLRPVYRLFSWFIVVDLMLF
jgi:hypothetical protein